MALGKERHLTRLDRYRRDRLVIVTLVLLILGASLTYAWFAVGTAAEIRKRHALDRNLTTAQLSARLLDDQWVDLLSVLKELQSNGALETAFRTRDQSTLHNHL